MNKVLNRLREPSTWAGLGAIAYAVEGVADTGLTITSQGGDLLTLAFGLLAVLIGERGRS